MNKKILLNLLLTLFSSSVFCNINFETTEFSNSKNFLSINEDPDFRGVWFDDYGSTIMIWIDEYGKYQYLLMDQYRNVIKTLKVELIGDNLLVETINLENDWKVTRIMKLIEEKKIYVEAKNRNGSFNSTLERLY